MKKRFSRKLLVALLSASLAVPLGLLYAQTTSEIVWTNGSGNNDWGNSGNWDIGFFPADFEWVVINLAGGDRAVFDSSEGNDILYLRVGEGEGVSGELDILSGTLNAAQVGSQSRFGSEGGAGTLNIMGGTLSIGGAQTHIGYGEGSTGMVNVSGGLLNVFREFQGTSVFIGAQGGEGTFHITGGSLRTRAGVQLGSVANPGDPENEEDDGWPAGVGVFSVEGSEPNEIGIGVEQSVPGRWIQNAGSVLRVRFDDIPPDFGGGARPIDVVQFNGQGGHVIFEEGALLDVDFMGAEVGGTFVVMRWQGDLTDNGLQFADTVDTEIWSFELDLDNKRLLVTSTAEGDNGGVPLGDDGTWIADADGNWSDAGNWEDGVVADGTSATADFATLNISAPRTVTLDASRTIGNLEFADISGENGWILGPEALDAASETESGNLLTLARIGGRPTIDVENGTVAIQRRLGGVQGFIKEGSGVLELNNPSHPLTGDLTVREGILRALAGGNGGMGIGTVGGAENRIVVEDGGTFQLGGNVQIANKQARIAGAGVDDGEGGNLGAFYVDATGLGNGTRWSHNGATNPALSLAADATIRVDGNGFGQNTSNVLMAHLDLGGHTLTKAGMGRITLDLNGAATGVGTLNIAEGVLGLTHNSIRNGVDLVIGQAGEVRGGRAPAPLNSTTNTVTVNGRLVMSERTDALATTQHIGVLQGSGVITTGIWGNTGTHTLNIHHPTVDSYFSGVIEEESGRINIVKGVVPDPNEENGEAEEPSTLTLDGMNSYSGNTTINHGSLVVGESGGLTFYITSPSANNQVAAGSNAVGVSLHLNGSFSFNLTEASTSMGSSWSPVNTTNLDVTVGETFRVAGFSQVEPGVWGTNANGVGYRFTEATLLLEVVDEFEDLETGFQQWQSEFLSGVPEAMRAPDADPDGDGLKNLAEYAFGGDPLRPYSAMPPSLAAVMEGEEMFLEITFSRIDASDIVYRVEAVDSLDAEWGENVIWDSSDHAYSGPEETVRDSQAIGNSGSRFLRVSVSQQ